MQAKLSAVTLAIGCILPPATVPAGASDPCGGARPALELVAELAGGDAERRRAMAWELRRSVECDPDFSTAVPEILDLFQDSDPEVREAAVCSVVGAGAAMPRLRGLVSDQAPGVRACVIPALVQADPEALADAFDALEDASEQVQMAARRALQTAAGRPRALPELTRALKDPRPEVRFAVAAALRGLGTRAPRDELVDLLADPESRVRLQAAATLADTAAILPEDVFNVLADGLAAGDEEERQRAVAVAQQLGTRAQPLLEPLLQAFEVAGEEQAQGLAFALAALAPVAPEARAALIAALEDSSKQAAALHVLDLVGGDLSETVPSLIAILEDGQDHSQWSAVHLLGEIGAAAGDAVPVLVRILENATRAEDARLRFQAQAAAEALGKIGGARAEQARSALGLLAKSGDSMLTAAALKALERLGGDRSGVVDQLLEQLSESDRGRRMRALAALESSAGDPAVRDRLPVLRELFQDSDSELRAGVAGVIWEVLGTNDPETRLAFVRQLAADWDPAVRARAADLAARDAWVLVKDEGLLFELLEDPAASVRAISAYALADPSLDARSTVPRLIALLADPDPGVRLAAIRVLGGMGPDAGDAIPALEELESDDLELRRARAEALADIAEEGRDGEVEEDLDLASQTPEQALMTAETRAQEQDRSGAALAYEHALAGFRAGGHRAGEAQALVGLGFLAFQAGRTEQASLRLEEARAVLSELELPELSANVWYLLGHLRNREGLPQEARAALDQALLSYGEAGSVQGELLTQAMLAYLDFGAGKTAEAQARYREIVRRSESGYMSAIEVRGLFGLGECQVRAGTLAQAHDTYSVALVKAQQQADKESMAIALASRGAILVQQGELERAGEELQEARKLLGDVSNPVGVALVALFAAELQTLRAETDAARRSADEALDVFRRAKESTGELAARLVLARLDLVAGAGGSQISDLVEAAESRQLVVVQAEAKLLLGILERRRGRYPSAFEALEQARTLFEGMNSTTGAARVGLERYRLELEDGRVDAARSTAEQAAATLGDAGHRLLRAEAVRALAELDLFAGRHAEARDALLEVAESWEGMAARWPLASALHTLGRVETRQGRLAEARRRLRAGMELAREAGSRAAQAELLVAFGELELAGARPLAAKKSFETARDLARDVEEPRVLAMALTGLGEVALKLEDLDTARQALGQGAALFEDIGSRPGQAEVTLSLARLALLEGDVEGASELFHRSRELFDQLGSVSGQARARAGLEETLRRLEEEQQAPVSYSAAGGSDPAGT